MNSQHSTLIPDETRARLAKYEAAGRTVSVQPGARLAEALEDESDFTTAPLRTKLPLIFAESAVAGDGSDWNLTELGVLGDISVAKDVTVFYDCLHTGPEVFDEPFKAGLVFVPGALLRSDGPAKPADWDELVDLDPEWHHLVCSPQLGGLILQLLPSVVAHPQGEIPGGRLQQRSKIVHRSAAVTRWKPASERSPAR